MQDTECQRQYRVLDQTLSMHAMLRDIYKQRALLLNCVLLIAAVVLNACVFVDDNTLTALLLNPGKAKVAIGIASVLVFAISIIELRVDWGGTSNSHKLAAEKLSDLKAKYRQCFDLPKEEIPKISQELSKEYATVFDDLPAIPEKYFNRLKQRHIRKKIISDRISRNPGAPIFLLKLQIWWEGIRNLAKNKKPSESPSCSDQ